MTEKRQTSQGYIIRILQHFATKLWNITNFVMLFQVVMKFLSRSKFSLLRKWSIQKRLSFANLKRAQSLMGAQV
jgi:valyl-tRNA synthetase